MADEILFTKMHGAGNDFIVIDSLQDAPKDPSGLAKILCMRRFSVGADGMILVLPSDVADYRMRIFNPDGSEAEMCGNGIRCFAKYLQEKGICKKSKLSVETLAGILYPELLDDAVRVDMGEPILARSKIPMRGDSERVLGESIQIDGKTLNITAVSMGNPHAITFVEDLADYPVKDIGSKLEKNPAFPKKTNVEFVRIVSDDELEVRVWERGAGETLACGTGACASLVAASLNGKTKRSAKVNLPGGSLIIEWDESNNHIYMTGPAETAYEGKILVGSRWSN